MAGILARLLRRDAPGAAVAAPVAASANGGGASPALPSWGWGGGAWGSGMTGYPYGGYFQENLASIVSAVTIIARTIASLPPRVYQSVDGGRVEVLDHPVVALLHRPNSLQGWPDLAEQWVASALLAGNGLLYITDDGRGAPTELRCLPWWTANPQILRDGRVMFYPAATRLPGWPDASPPRVVSTEDCLWLRDRADNVFGRSALSRAPMVAQAAINSAQFAASMFASGAKLGGVITHPGHLSKEASDRIAASWAATHAGPISGGKTAILEEGMTFAAQSMTLEDAELLSSRKFEIEEVARLYNIPLPILNVWDHSTFTNSDTASQWFGQLTLAPWARKIEAEASRVLFNDASYHLEIDLSALMRGSFVARTQAEIALVRAGILSANEVREQEGYSRRGGDADKLVMQSIGGRPNGPDDPGALPTPGATPP
jgi:HK97 family phage portal protein